MNPNSSNADAAVHFGVSRQRVSQLCKSTGVRLARKPRKRFGVRTATAASINGSRFVGEYLKSVGALETGRHAGNRRHVGAVAEMLVAADLFARGWTVFAPLTAMSKFDFVAYLPSAARLVRVEVKTGSGWPDPTRDGHYDILARVGYDMKISYSPDL